MKQISVNKRIWFIIVSGTLLFATVFFSVGNTYSRYINQKNTFVVYADKAEYSWKFLDNMTAIEPYRNDNEGFDPIVDGDASEDLVQGNVSRELNEGDASEDVNEDESSGELNGGDASENVNEDESSGELNGGDAFENVNEDESSGESNKDDVFQDDITDEESVDKEESDEDVPAEEGTVETDTQYLELLYIDNDVAVIEISYPENSDAVVLSFNGNEFPEGTGYSVDGIQGYSLSEAGFIRLTSDSRIILLQLTGDNTEELKGKFFEGENLLADASLVLEKNENSIWSVDPVATKTVMGKHGNITWKITNLFDNGELLNRISVLGEDGYLVIETKDFMSVMVSDSGPNLILNVINNGSVNTPAGTYELNIAQTIKTDGGNVIELMNISVPFFVNYR